MWKPIKLKRVKIDRIQIIPSYFHSYPMVLVYDQEREYCFNLIKDTIIKGYIPGGIEVWSAFLCYPQLHMTLNRFEEFIKIWLKMIGDNNEVV